MSSRRGGRTVAVAQAGTPVGRAILERLVPAARRAGGPITTVRGIDTQRAQPYTAQWRIADCTGPQVAAALDGVDTLIWAAGGTDLESTLGRRAADRRLALLRTGQALVTAAAAMGVRQVVVITSARVLGAAADNPVPLAEDSPLTRIADDGQVGDLIAIEHLVDRARRAHPGVTFTVVRPAAVVGPEVDTVTTRHFEAPRLLVVRGASPAWQFCHIDDLASAVERVVIDRLGPVVSVGSEGWLTQAQIEGLTGMRRIEVSEAVALGTAQRLHRVGVLPTPVSDLAYVLHPWVVSSQRLVEAGWQPVFDNESCVAVLLASIRGRHAVAGRRVDRKDAALGAASAAVALVGTAAILRRSRRS